MSGLRGNFFLCLWRFVLLNTRRECVVTQELLAGLRLTGSREVGEGDEVAVPLIGWTRYQVHMHAGLEYRVPGSPRWQLLLRGLSSPVSRDDGHEA